MVDCGTIQRKGSPFSQSPLSIKGKREIDFLSRIQLFSSLSEDELSQIRDKVIIRKFKKNETILYEADTNNAMYVVLEGKVKVVQSTEDGKEILLAFHQAGDFFGEMSLIDGKTAPATVVATENSVAAIIMKRDFYALLHVQKKFLENLLHIFCSRLRESWERIQMLNFKNASHRIKTLLLMLAEEHGKETPDGIVLTIKLTHQEMADMTGLTRETVTRAIDRWQRDGEISILANRCICMRSGFQRDLPLVETSLKQMTG